MFVLMCNDYPEAIFSSLEAAARYVSVKWPTSKRWRDDRWEVVSRRLAGPCRNLYLRAEKLPLDPTKVEPALYPYG